MPLLTDKDFDYGSAVDSGGATGSMQVTGEGGQKYQLKSSIKNAKWSRRVKARGTDRENFGEVIASCIGREVLPATDGVDLVPEVSMVHDTRNNTASVASKYLDNVQGTLDDFAQNQDVKFKKHTRTTFKDPPAPGEVSLAGDGDDKKLLRQDLANAIAVSVIIGDHDVNPGNMLHVKDGKGRDRVARIDFGHAFNDLLNAPKAFGGQVANKDNTVMDFFNRETVGHLRSQKRETKLWRDFDGIIPSEEMATALEAMAAKQDNVGKGIAVAAQQFSEMSAKDPTLAQHIKKSLAAISNNVTGEKLDTSKPVDQCIVKAFENLSNFSTKQCEQMRDVATVMQLQVAIDEGIAKDGGKNIDQDMLKDMTNQLKGKAGIEKDGQIQWMKNSRHSKAFKGTVTEYIAHRKEQLQAQEKDVALSNDKKSGKVEEYQVTNNAPIKAQGHKNTNFVKRGVKAVARGAQAMVNKMRRGFGAKKRATVTTAPRGPGRGKGQGQSGGMSM